LFFKGYLFYLVGGELVTFKEGNIFGYSIARDTQSKANLPHAYTLSVELEYSFGFTHFYELNP